MQRIPSCQPGEYQGKAPSGNQVRLQDKSEVCTYLGKIVKPWREMNEQTLEQLLEQPQSA
jgi:hypothetical protein